MSSADEYRLVWVQYTRLHTVHCRAVLSMKVTMMKYPPPEGNIHIVRGGLAGIGSHKGQIKAAVQAADNLGLGGVGPWGKV